MSAPPPTIDYSEPDEGEAALILAEISGQLAAGTDHNRQCESEPEPGSECRAQRPPAFDPDFVDDVLLSFVKDSLSSLIEIHPQFVRLRKPYTDFAGTGIDVQPMMRAVDLFNKDEGLDLSLAKLRGLALIIMQRLASTFLRALGDESAKSRIEFIAILMMKMDEIGDDDAKVIATLHGIQNALADEKIPEETNQLYSRMIESAAWKAMVSSFERN